MFGAGGFGQQTQTPTFGAAAPAAGGFGTTFGAFGQQPAQQPAFGAQAAAPAFGASPAPAFGAAAAPAFGASPAPAFGAASASAFGATASPAFGGTGFGASAAKPAGFGAFGGGTSAFGAASQPATFGSGLGTAFGASSTPAFGATTAPAFGAASTAAFGSQPGAFGSTSQTASPFGGTTTSLFGAASQPAAGTGLFGSTPQPAASAFGTPAATSTPGLFGAGAFGAAAPGSAGATGTRVAPYQKTVERDGTSTTGAATPANFMTISAMPQYQSKSLEELRWEDYQAGVKNASAGPVAPAAAPAATGLFGQQSPAPAFGLGATTTTGAFGTPAASTPAFGAAASTPAFGTGLFGAASSAAPAFGSTTTTSAFGAPAAGNPFGAATTTPSPFGATTPAPAFGAAPAAANPFGAATTTPSPFGATSTAPRPAGTGVFGFGSSPAPAFGAASSPSPFGATTTPSLFGAASQPATGTGLFGAAAPAAASPFGTPAATTTPGMFGAKPATPGFGTTTTSAFGASTGGAFGTTAFGQTGGGLFGGGTSTFGASTPSLFGANSSPSLFGANSSPSLFGGNTFGTQQPTQALGLFQSTPAMGQPQVAPPSVSAAPYGAFPNLPAVPEPKVGIGSKPARPTMGFAGRASPLVSLKATATASTPGRLGAVTAAASRGTTVSPLGSLGPLPGEGDITTTSITATPGTGTPGLLKPRANPHQLFIREPPPGTSASQAGASAFTPAQPTPGGNAAAQQTPIQNGRTAAGPSAQNGAVGTPYNPFPLATPDGRATAERGADANGAGRGAAGRAGTSEIEPNDEPVATPASARRVPRMDLTPRDNDGDVGYLPRLGRLAEEGYSFTPSSAQLRSMYETDPDSLAKVSGFTVEREGYGSIRWLVPVDVRGLKLDDIISIIHGEVSCYTEGTNKPPEGEGLNQEALITLLEVYLKDKESGQHITEGPGVIKWEKKLRKMCASMGARFVSYKPAGGVWKFEVEHFSRYGIREGEDVDNSDVDEDETYQINEEHNVNRAALGAGAARAARSGDEPELTFGGDTARADQDMDEVGREEGTQRTVNAAYGNGSLIPRGQRAGGPKRPAARPVAPSQPLQHTLPPNTSPQAAAEFLDTFFRGGDDTQQQPAAARTRDIALYRDPPAAAAPQPTAATAPFGAQPGAYGRVPRRGARTTALNVWESRPAPLTSVQPRAMGPLETATESATALTGGAEGAAAPRQMAGEDSATAAHHTDAGLTLGMSFRVGWGPGGQLLIPGPPGVRLGSDAQPVQIKRVVVEGHGSGYGDAGGSDRMEEGQEKVEAPRLTSLRTQLRALLNVHLRHSRPTTTLSPPTHDSAPTVPQWQLVCSPETLPELVGDLVGAVLDPKASLERSGVSMGVGVEEALSVCDMDDEWQADVKHEVETWRLLQVLFEAQPPGEWPQPLLGTPDEGQPGTMMLTDGEGALANSVVPEITLALNRQAGFSRWLQQQVLPEMRQALQTGGGTSSAAESALHWLTAHHLIGAAAVMMSAGDVRLGTLLAAAGLKAPSVAEARQQLEVWQSTGMTPRIHPDRVLVYKLLAGEVSEVIQRLQLDWQRALGLYVWYYMPPVPRPVSTTELWAPSGPAAHTLEGLERNQTGALADAIKRYKDNIDVHLVPKAKPPHVRNMPPSEHATVTSNAVDMQYTLLRLWEYRERMATKAGGGGQLPVAAAVDLLAAASHSSNPCAAALPWALLSVLQALGVVTDVSDSTLDTLAHIGDAEREASVTAALSACMGLIGELLMVSEVPEWAVYVALHLPDRGGGLRQAVVRTLLQLTAPQWVHDDARTTLLARDLHIPQSWLADAAANWAMARHDLLAAVRHYLTAQQWGNAHDLLMKELAPQLVCQNRSSDLHALLAALEPHRSSCPGWDHNGGIYLRYLTLVLTPTADTPTTPTTQPTSIELQTLVSDLARLRDAAVRAMGKTGLSGRGGGDTGDSPELVRLTAMDVMAKRAQEAVMQALAREFAQGPAYGGVLNLPCLMGPFGQGASTRGTGVCAAAFTLTAQVLAAS